MAIRDQTNRIVGRRGFSNHHLSKVGLFLYIILSMAAATSDDAVASQIDLVTRTEPTTISSNLNRNEFQPISYDGLNGGGFSLIYQDTNLFDICGKPALGKLSRHVLEMYYKICIAGGDPGGVGMAQLQQGEAILQRDIKENDTIDIDHFLRNVDEPRDCWNIAQSVAYFQRLMQGYANGAFKWNVPRDCNDDWKWLGN